MFGIKGRHPQFVVSPRTCLWSSAPGHKLYTNGTSGDGFQNLGSITAGRREERDLLIIEKPRK